MSLAPQGLYEVWGEGATWEELEASIKKGLPTRDAAYFAADASWRIWVDGFGCSTTDPVALLNQLEFVPFEGPVRLEDPQHSFRLLRVSGPTCISEPARMSADALYLHCMELLDRLDLVPFEGRHAAEGPAIQLQTPAGEHLTHTFTRACIRARTCAGGGSLMALASWQWMEADE